MSRKHTHADRGRCCMSDETKVHLVELHCCPVCQGAGVRLLASSGEQWQTSQGRLLGRQPEWWSFFTGPPLVVTLTGGGGSGMVMLKAIGTLVMVG